MIRRTVPQESDLIFHPDGRASVSFLWNDIASVFSTDAPVPVMTAPESRFSPVTAHERLRHLERDADLTDAYTACAMCPRACGYDRVAHDHPRCGGVSIRVGTWGLTLGDEPEIRGRKGSGAIMLSGCPLSCPSCHNPEMVKDGRETSLAEILEICIALRESGAQNIQFLSPTVHGPKLRVLLRALKDADFELPIVLKSSGYESISELARYEDLVDIYLPDLKFGSCSAFARRAGVPDYFTQARLAINEMFRQVGRFETDAHGYATKGVLVRHVKAPLPEAERNEVTNFLASIAREMRISILENFTSLE